MQFAATVSERLALAECSSSGLGLASLARPGRIPRALVRRRESRNSITIAAGPPIAQSLCDSLAPPLAADWIGDWAKFLVHVDIPSERIIGIVVSTSSVHLHRLAAHCLSLARDMVGRQQRMGHHVQRRL